MEVVYLWPLNLDSKFVLLNSLFGTVKLTKNDDLDEYFYFGYVIEFDPRGTFSLPAESGFGKNVIIFGVDDSSSVNADHRKIYILILGKGPANGLADTTLTAEAEYSINLSKQQKKFCLSFPLNGSNSFLQKSLN